VATVIPKMLKCASFEEKQFNHLKDFLLSEREALNKTVNTLVLNLPYFRDDQSVVSLEKFTVISEERLSNINKRIEGLTFRPRKLRIMYSTSPPTQATTTYPSRHAGHRGRTGTQAATQEKFIRLLEGSENLKEVEALEFYCT
jgi:hypothetical protein